MLLTFRLACVLIEQMTRTEAPNTSEQAQKESIWADFVASEVGESGLESVLHDKEVDPFFRRRVLDIYLTPEFLELPFPYARNNMGRLNWTFSGDICRGLGSEEAVWAAKLVEEFVPQVREKANLAKEPQQVDKTLAVYNQRILALLPKLPIKEAKRLLGCYQICIPRDNFLPLRELLRSEVAEELKQATIDRLHREFEEELAGLSPEQREVRKKGFSSSYSGSWTHQIYDNYPGSASQEILEGEISFLLALAKRPLFPFYSIDKVIGCIDDSELKERLLENEVFGGYEAIQNMEQLRAARAWLKEFPDNPVIQSKLAEKIAAYEAQLQEEDQKRQAAKDTLTTHLAKMGAKPTVETGGGLT